MIKRYIKNVIAAIFGYYTTRPSIDFVGAYNNQETGIACIISVPQEFLEIEYKKGIDPTFAAINEIQRVSNGNQFSIIRMDQIPSYRAKRNEWKINHKYQIISTDEYIPERQGEFINNLKDKQETFINESGIASNTFNKGYFEGKAEILSQVITAIENNAIILDEEI